VALAIALGDVEERLFRARIGAEIGEGRGLHADQRGRFFASVRGSVSVEVNKRPSRARCAPCAAPRQCNLTLDWGRLSLAVENDRRIAAGNGLRTCRRCLVFCFVFAASIRRSALPHWTSTRTAERRGSYRNQCHLRRRATQHNRGVALRAICYLEFRISSDHPPTAPRSTQDPPSTGVRLSRLGELPEKLPTSGKPEETMQSCRDCGTTRCFRNPVVVRGNQGIIKPIFCSI
jgi:hypothetical protein